MTQQESLNCTLVSGYRTNVINSYQKKTYHVHNYTPQIQPWV